MNKALPIAIKANDITFEQGVSICAFIAFILFIIYFITWYIGSKQ